MCQIPHPIDASVPWAPAWPGHFNHRLLLLLLLLLLLYYYYYILIFIILTRCTEVVTVDSVKTTSTTSAVTDIRATTSARGVAVVSLNIPSNNELPIPTTTTTRANDVDHAVQFGRSTTLHGKHQLLLFWLSVLPGKTPKWPFMIYVSSGMLNIQTHVNFISDICP